MTSRCSFCGSKFGLIRYHSWLGTFCSRRCKRICQRESWTYALVRFFKEAYVGR
jgi:hypothetical protein